MNKQVKQLSISKIVGERSIISDDILAVEEPLEIRLDFGPVTDRTVKNISVTMRTPGNDMELAMGFLFTEGIVKSFDEITEVFHPIALCQTNTGNVIQVSLKTGTEPALQNSERNFYTTSSCGICGKASINAIRTTGATIINSDKLTISSELLHRLPQLLKQQQAVFEETGGLHAAALFDNSGHLLLVREDVGRHNALDKLIGAALTKNRMPLDYQILLLSGRASFELIQKAIMAGIRIIASVGAPSSLAVELAEEFGVSLIGFLRDGRFNIYTSPHRVLLPAHENTY
ncbi:formate dehydrogenase accessory sulfurtransferase FdhD [Mucilaginibacter gynuensis]|uniref:Sulfur carrier protein FdhD n=1 Tax=Mucilaginibacter gynuensis TaxID=1302236 RepID=A0ABP8GLY5_9SPHI